MGRWCMALALAMALQAHAGGAMDDGSEPRPDLAAGPPSAGMEPHFTLEEAWRRAEDANPSLAAARAAVTAAEGRSEEARAFLWSNPVLSAERARRVVPSGGPGEPDFLEWNAGVSQTFEVGGQPGYRRHAAASDLDAARLDAEAVRRALRADVELAFVGVLALQRRIEIERDTLRLVEDAAAAVAKRVEAGEDTVLDGNLAAVESERARNQLAALGEQLTEARVRWAALLQLAPSTLPVAAGELRAARPAIALDRLIERARRNPRLAALASREEAARARLRLERAVRIPDVTVGLVTGREGPLGLRERLSRVTVSVPLPLFRRNAAGVGQATAGVEVARTRRLAAEREAEAIVRAASRNLESQEERIARLARSVLPRLDENRRLSMKAYEAGEIGLLQLLVVNRQLVDARRDYLEALTEAARARVDLERAAGGFGAAE